MESACENELSRDLNIFSTAQRFKMLMHFSMASTKGQIAFLGLSRTNEIRKQKNRKGASYFLFHCSCKRPNQ